MNKSCDGPLAKTRELRALLPIDFAAELFNPGYRLDAQGYTEQADIFYQRTIDYLERLQQSAHANLSDEALANCALHHGLQLYQLGRLGKARPAFGEAVARYQSLIPNGVSSRIIRHCAQALRFLGRTQYRQKDLNESLISYRRALGLLSSLILIRSHINTDQSHDSQFTAILAEYRRVITALNQENNR